MNSFTFPKLNKAPVTDSRYGYSFAPEYPVSFVPRKCGTYRIEINAAIEDVSQFSTAIHVLNMATDDDEVEIHLQCPGGNVDASGAFLHALRKCPAHVHITASGGCHSAATHILLDGDSIELAENFNSLIHNGSSGAFGNINEYHSKSDFDKKFIYDQYWGIYEGFLSKEEFDGVMRGDQIWLNAQQWMDRAVARSEYFQNKYSEQQAQEEEMMLAQVEAELANRESKALKVPKTRRTKKSVDSKT